jgi:hypothetical protein
VKKLSSKKAIKEATLEKEEVISLVEMFAELMSAYGSFAGSLGKIQKTHEEAYEDMFSLEAIERLPEMLSNVMKEAPEVGKLVVTIFAKMTAFLPRIAKIMELPADDKIALGEKLKSLAKDFRKLREWVEKEEKK